MVWLVAGLGSLGTVTLTSVGIVVETPWVAYLSALVVGASAGTLWVLWGERLACQGARFTLERVGPTYGGVLLALVGFTYLAPEWLSPGIIAALPLVSALLLHVQTRELSDCHPRLLPVTMAAQGKRTMITLTSVSFVASFVCYYTVAIVPWSSLGKVEDAFAYGILSGALLILALTALQRLGGGVRSTFRVYPWLLIVVVLACVLYLTDQRAGAAAFLIAVAASSLFEILLTLYMGVLTQRGYILATPAFAFAGGAIRLGIFCGNGLALIYERTPGLLDALTRPTFVLLVLVMTGLLITVVRQEYAIEELTRTPSTESALEAMIQSVAEEFRLSEREREVMALVGQGYSAAAVAEKLFVSPYTVNSHIQHIYRKLGIHKRSELIAYLRQGE